MIEKQGERDKNRERERGQGSHRRGHQREGVISFGKCS